MSSNQTIDSATEVVELSAGDAVIDPQAQAPRTFLQRVQHNYRRYMGKGLSEDDLANNLVW